MLKLQQQPQTVFDFPSNDQVGLVSFCKSKGETIFEKKKSWWTVDPLYLKSAEL